MRPPHVVIVNQNAPLEFDQRPRREAETLAAAGYAVTLVAGSDSPEHARALTAPDVRLELYEQPREGSGVAGQVREQTQAMARALLALRRAARHAPVAAVHAGNPPDNLFLARRALAPVQGSMPRFVYDQHDAAPVLVQEKFSATALVRPLAATARAIERRSFAAAGLVVFANAEYRARAEREGLLRGDHEVVMNGWSLPRRSRITASGRVPSICSPTSARSPSRTTSTGSWTRSRPCRIPPACGWWWPDRGRPSRG